jgi:hypothetical protein
MNRTRILIYFTVVGSLVIFAIAVHAQNVSLDLNSNAASQELYKRASLPTSGRCRPIGRCCSSNRTMAMGGRHRER